MSVDFTRGGYRGDPVEEHFKWFTARHMPFWWHFREVLRASDRASAHWRRSDGADLSKDEHGELVALSLLNYAVYTGMAEALAFLKEMGTTLSTTTQQQSSGSGVVPLYSTSASGILLHAEGANVLDHHAEWPARRLFEARRSWKAAYSSLYTSFNALCNIVCVVVGQKPVFKKTRPAVWNYSPKDALNLARGMGCAKLVDPLGRCKDRLEIRDHLDHYWLIWHNIVGGKLLLDEGFEKGRLPTHPKSEVSLKIDAYERARNDMEGSADDFNRVYRELAVKDGPLDQYLLAKCWAVDYSDSPHGGQRPLP